MGKRKLEIIEDSDNEGTEALANDPTEFEGEF